MSEFDSKQPETINVRDQIIDLVTSQQIDLIWTDLEHTDLDCVSLRHGGCPGHFRLTRRGIEKIVSSIVMYLDAEYCPHPNPQSGDGIHINGDEVELICLNSPTLVGAGETE